MASYASIEPARPSSQTSFHPHHLSYRQHPGLELMQVAGIYCYLLLGIQPALYRYPRYGFAVRILVSRRNEVSKSLTFFVFRLFVVSGLCGISPKISLISLISLVKRLCLFRKRPKRPSDHRDQSEAADNADNDNAELTTPIPDLAFVSFVSFVSLVFQKQNNSARQPQKAILRLAKKLFELSVE